MTPAAVPAPGSLFGRFVKAVAIGKGDFLHSQAYASGNGWDDIARATKALVGPISLPELGAAMRPIEADFAALLRPLTVVDRFPGLRRAPLDVRVGRASVGGSATFVAEGAPTPVSKEGLDQTVQFFPYKLAGIQVFTADVVRSLAVSATNLIAADVAASIAEGLDKAFIDPSFGAVASTRPASITNGATRLTSSGSTIAAIDADLKAMIAVLAGAAMPLTTAAWIMSPITATSLALLRGSGGSPAFPGVTARGGELLGLPVLTSTACNSAGSPGERFIALVEGSQVLYGDDGTVRIEASGNAAVQMNDAPSAGAQPLTSLRQLDLVGVRGVKFCDYALRRPGAAVVLESVTY